MPAAVAGVPVTIDASAAAAWLLPDEASAAADRLYAEALQTTGAFQAPALFAWETGNLLAMAQRRSRITAAHADAALRVLSRAAVRLEGAPDEARLRATLDLARIHRLTVYDASYLEQALRTGARLATKDADLKREATKAGVECLDL